MARMNKKSKIITGVAVTLAAIVGVGAVGLVSKGFQNWDVRDWVDGYKNVLEVSEDAQYLCTNASCSGDCEFTQDERAVIGFKSGEDNIAAHGSAKLFDQAGKELKKLRILNLRKTLMIQISVLATFIQILLSQI